MRLYAVIDYLQISNSLQLIQALITFSFAVTYLILYQKELLSVSVKSVNITLSPVTRYIVVA